MFLHIIPNEKFTLSYIEFIQSAYPLNDNKFYVHYDGARFITDEFENVKLINKLTENKKEILAECKNAKKIFIHGFYRDNLILFLAMNYTILKKAVLVIWGADLYNNHYFFQENKGIFLRKRLVETLKKFVVSRVKYFMTFTYADYDILAEWYNAEGKQYDCLYPSTVNKDLLTSIYIDKKEKKTTNIMIGNSATKTNRHAIVLNRLEKYKDEDICIYCPLSYGDNEYGDSIKKLGNKIFSNKFIPIEDYMTPDNYTNFLACMDIAIFYHNRQQATGNIEILGYFGKKIYLCSETSTWKHYVCRDNCFFFDFNDIENEDFKDFICFNENQSKLNHDYFSNIWDVEYIKKLWDAVFFDGES